MSKPVASMRIGTETVDATGHALSVALNKWFTESGPSAIYRNCDNCRHMVEDGPAMCTLFNATPPASVIVVGCPSHDDKEQIPF